ncbi:MAG: polysaccharide deacetylase family protein [Candidatus Kerfeldbacteria bacterium]|nr:polysaccharide deacetylase family protein [Candidatus Kerfeldbacteria bacterium]
MASLNFDDGWKNFYTNALPLLQKAKVKATLYPVSGYVKERRKQFMTAALLRAVEAQGHEIGAHTQYHVLLTKVTRQRADREIRQSRQDLEDLGVRSVTTFAYPYGVYSRRLRGVVRETGYSGARISSCGLNSPRSDRLLLKTCAVSRKMKVARLKSWIDDAVREKRWLIITFHDVQKKPRRYGTTPNVLEEILKYLKQKRVRVVTNSQGLQIINEIRLTN